MEHFRPRFPDITVYVLCRQKIFWNYVRKKRKKRKKRHDLCEPNIINIEISTFLLINNNNNTGWCFGYYYVFGYYVRTCVNLFTYSIKNKDSHWSSKVILFRWCWCSVKKKKSQQKCQRNDDQSKNMHKWLPNVK